jgi:hypothetical protein
MSTYARKKLRAIFSACNDAGKKLAGIGAFC